MSLAEARPATRAGGCCGVPFALVFSASRGTPEVARRARTLGSPAAHRRAGQWNCARAHGLGPYFGS